MIDLLGVAAIGLWFGRGPSVLSAILNVVAFGFFFVPPQFTFAVTDMGYVITFAVMLTIGLVIATLMESLRQKTRVAGTRERCTALLCAVSRELAAARGAAQMASLSVKQIAEAFDCVAIVLLPIGALLPRDSDEHAAKTAASAANLPVGSIGSRPFIDSTGIAATAC